MNVFELLRMHGSRTAVVTDHASFSYDGLADRTKTRMQMLESAGIGAGSVVGLEIADEVEHLVHSLALLALGARHVTLLSHDPQAARTALATRAGVTHVVTAKGVSIEPNAPGAPATGEGVVYLKTSGTTGDMNIIAFTARQIADQASRHPEYSTDRLLRLASIEHNNSKRHRLYCAVQGGTNVFRPPTELDVGEFCRRHQVSCLDISRMHASDLASSGQLGRFPGIKLRTGGSAIPIDVRRAIEARVTAELYVRYAATECGAIAMARPGEHDDDEVVGRPLPGVDLEIVDGADRPLPPGESGRIRLRAPGMATGYLDGGEQTQSRFRNGWFWPGDVGTIRADGCLIVQGRQDDMMVLNGVNIFPSEIERVLERHPAVSVAAALPLPSQVHGQIPVAAVELNPGSSTSTAELMTFVRDHLALRAPRRIIILPTLPRNGQGKIVRREIAAMFQSRPNR